MKTKNGLQQFILMMKKFELWQEELNVFILIVEQCGILVKWGDKKVEEPENPYSFTESDLESKPIPIWTLGLVFIALGNLL